ncbi:MAG: hypothetical protein WCS37_00505 [Chloroflexota bacterium]|nr:hypothetical protein [Chloroflexota bacterium]
MKRLLSVLFLLSLCLQVLAACGEAAPVTTGPTTNAPATTVATTNAPAITLTIGTTITTTIGGSNTTAIATITATKGITTASAGNLGLPIYSELKPLSLGSTIEQALSQGITGLGSSTVKYAVFNTSSSATQVLGYYDGQMKTAGFTKSGEQEIPPQSGVNLAGKIAGYQKGNGTEAIGAAITIFGPLDANTVALFVALSPNAAQQLKAGDSIVVIFNNLGGSTLRISEVTPSTRINTGGSLNITPAANPTK